MLAKKRISIPEDKSEEIIRKVLEKKKMLEK